MTVLNYAIHENLATHHVVLEKLKDFVQAQGWTVHDWLTSVQWAWTGSQYDFIAGSESFLRIQSNGYGSQTLHYRFRGKQTGSDPNHEEINCGSQNAANTALDHTSNLHPVDRNKWNLFTSHSFKPTNIPKFWLFGNSKFVLLVAKMDNIWCETICFGSPELIDTSDDESMYLSYEAAGSLRWYNYNAQDCLYFEDRVFYFDGRVETNAYFHQSGIAAPYGFAYKNVTLLNEYSQARPVYKPIVYVKPDVDGLWRVWGWLPLYRVWAEGLQFGEILQYGTKQFMCFPSNKLNDASRYYGIAVRIA